MQDCETGEPDFVHSKLPDEIISFNEETGEPDVESFKMYFRKTKFHVPKEYLEQPNEENHKKCKLDCKETYSLTSKSKIIHLKEEIILGYNKTSHRLFLIPTFFFFTKISAVILAICEIGLHVWAHKKNSKNTNPNTYYRSPLHILTSQFCAICRAQTEWDHINKLQDRTRKLHLNLKRVTRSLS